MQELLRLFSGFAVIISLALFRASYKHVVIQKNAYGLTKWLFPLGIFVWADGLIISLFWLLLSLFTILLRDLWFLLAAISLFWLVRSIGETIYWMLQQFVQPNANKPHTLIGHRWIKGDELWIVYQVAWQCMTIISCLGFAYSLHRWLIDYM